MTWKCNCPLCRIFVHPVLNRVSGKSEGSVEALPQENVEEKISEVEEKGELLAPIAKPEKPRGGGEGEEGSELIPPVPLPESASPTPNAPQATVSQVPLPPTATPTPSSSETEGSAATAPPASIEVQIPREFAERIDQLEEEIGKLRKELSTINESLKGVILEVKEVLAEASSPFALLRTPLEERGKKEKEFNGGKKKIKETSQPTVLASKVSLPPSKFVYLTKLASDMLKKMGKEKAVELVKGYIETGVLDKKTGETLVKIIELVDKMHSYGLSVEEQLPFLYSLAKTLGIEDPELEKIVLKELLVRRP